MAIKRHCHHHHRRRHHQIYTSSFVQCIKNRKQTPPLLCSQSRLHTHREGEREREFVSSMVWAGKGNTIRNSICFTLHCDFFSSFFLSFLSTNLTRSIAVTPPKLSATRYRLQNGDDDYCKQHVPCFNSHSQLHITHRLNTEIVHKHTHTDSVYRTVTLPTYIISAMNE